MAIIHTASADLSGGGGLDARAVVIHTISSEIVGEGRMAPVPAVIRPANDDKPRLKGDTAAAISFLEHWAPDTPWVLTAIDPDRDSTKKPTDTQVFHASSGADRVKQATVWIERYQGRWNIYFTPNRINDAWLGHKPSKVARGDIGWLNAIHVDVDPRDGCDLASEQQRIRGLLMAHQPAFDIIVFSGGGFQAFYLLKEPVVVHDPDKAAMLNRRLEKHLTGATQCYDISHIMRLPGSINMPNKKKRDNGRVPARAELVAVPGNWERRYTFADLQAAANEWGDDEPGPKPPPDASFIDTLPISDRMRDLVRGIDDPEHPYHSRSERVFAVMIAMVGAGCTEDTIRAVFLNPRYPISAHVLENRNFDQQLDKARQAVHDSDVHALNQTYAVVLVGGRAAIMKEGLSPLGGHEFSFYGVDALHTWFGNRVVMEGTKRVTLAKHWLAHPLRRQYEGIVFAPKREAPGHYNLWRGFAVEPRAGDCSLFLAHIHDVACGGIKDHYNWVMAWFAQLIQHPETKMGTCLCFRGEPGTGKTIIGEMIKPVLGPHYYRVADPRYITGQFNSHLIACLLLHADEGFWAGDHKAEGKVKDLTTSDEQMIEFKHKEVIRVRNHVRLMVTGNANWIVPAAMDERRFAVFDVADTHQEDHAYFGAMLKQMDNGGYAALLHHLLHLDWGGINLRTVPKTGALLDQKLASLNPEDGWWADVLRSGRLPHGCGSPNMTPSSLLFDSYVQHANKTGARRRAIETQIGMYLNRIVGADLVKAKATYRNTHGEDEAGNVYTFPPLAECRARFVAALHQKIDWGSVEEWLPAPKWNWHASGQPADANERRSDPPLS
jgi:hypothetical protein